MDYLDIQTQIWAMAHIQIYNIVHGFIDAGKTLEHKTSTNAFVFLHGNNGKVSVNDEIYSFSRFAFLHIEKDNDISVYGVDMKTEYYIVLYNRGNSFVSHSEMNELLKNGDVIDKSYCLCLNNPIKFAEYFNQMYINYKRNTHIGILLCKGIFYQMVGELFEQLSDKAARFLETDYYSMAVQYLSENYTGQVSIHALIDSLNISSSQLNRVFKKRLNMSPQQYLTSLRIEKAKELLKNDNATVNQIAHLVGFVDDAQFFRVFKEKCGSTPNVYREKFTVNEGKKPIDSVKLMMYNNMVVSICKLVADSNEFSSKDVLSNDKFVTLIRAAICISMGETIEIDEVLNITANQNYIAISNFNSLTSYEKVPQRIISLNYSATQILVALGLKDKIVGIAKAEGSDCDCMPKYQSDVMGLHIICGSEENYGVPALEDVLRLNPDFVFGSMHSFNAVSGVGNVEDFSDNGINIYVSKSTYLLGAALEDVYEDILNIGRIFRVESKSVELINHMKTEIDEIKKMVIRTEQKISVFVCDYAREKAYTSGNSLESTLIRLAGGVNIFENVDSQFFSASWQFVAEQNPEVIVIHRWNENDDPQSKISYIKNLQEMKNTDAVINNRYIIIPLEYTFPGLQNVEVIKEIAKCLNEFYQ